MATDTVISGGCGCGAVRFTARGKPVRVGVCHCLTCRKSHASAFNPFVVFRREQVVIQGMLATWQSSVSWTRSFCPACGSPVLSEYQGDPEVELSLGSFDEPGLFRPQYEMWVVRREPWLQPLDVPQLEGNRPDGWSPSPTS